MQTLKGKIAVVAGATRGAGRGIACMLGEAGALVYCTGRSVRGKPASGSRPETIEETAEMATARGGVGIAVQVDHTVEEQVQAHFARVREEQGKLDILVNDVWGGDELTEFGKGFWDVSLAKGRVMMERAILSHIITSHFAAPLMMETGNALIVEITDGDSYTYRGNIFYDLVKTSVIRLAFTMAHELRRKAVTVVALTPGFLRSEAVLEHFGVTEANWREGAKISPEFIASETPFFVGRAVAALAADAEVSKKSGRVFSSWGLAAEYGFIDVDGQRPDIGKYFSEHFGLTKSCDEEFYSYWKGGPMDALYPDWP
jgi:NAD(P)-dependent dehydrogenase (short-subunit alcohol dehydrogenase family)